jgi:hypothetical protein
MIIRSSNESVPCTQLNVFIHVYIQRNGIAYVVDNYNPIREQYYAQKQESQQKSQWEDRSNV